MRLPKTDKLESKISELELKHTATNTMSNVEQQQQATTPSKKQIVAIDSNVFVSRGAVSPDDTYIKEKIVGKGCEKRPNERPRKHAQKHERKPRRTV